MNTRKLYDDAQIGIKTEFNRDITQWILDVPGNGSAPPFVLDPHIILQKWGANLHTDATDLESSLRGYTQRLSKGDCLAAPPVHTSLIQYPTYAEPFTDEPRASEPAWQVRNIPTNYWNAPLGDPYIPITASAHTGIDTRMHMKKTYDTCNKNKSFI